MDARNLICLITPNHISSNPRLVKEATTLIEAGYNVHIVFTQHTVYLLEEDIRILQANPLLRYTVLNWTKKGFLPLYRRLFSGVLQKLARFMNKVLPLAVWKKLILNRHYFFQANAAVKVKADLYIAHYAGAVAIAAEAAFKLKKKFSFDAEDFHRGEVLNLSVAQATIFIENKYLPQAEYITGASPLIVQKYKSLINGVRIHLVRNVFPLKCLGKSISLTRNPLKLLWFSQTVGTNRGLQDIFEAMRLLEGRKIELHIFGFFSTEVEFIFNNVIKNLNFNNAPHIKYYGPISPDELLRRSSDFDIGLALEPGFCTNNKIALSNKIFTYLFGGNAIVFSDTPAQSQFYNSYKAIGAIYKSGDVESLSKILISYDDNRELLCKCRKLSRKLFETELNWDLEKTVFLDQVNQALRNPNIKI